MSNPAVIVLDKLTNSKKFKRFLIEDNIGESIHIHIDNMRLDFTIKEYLNFSNLIKDSLKELDPLLGYDINNFDESFLKECSEFLPNLKSIKKEKIKLSQLICIHRFRFLDGYLTYKLKINKTKVFKYLKKESNDFLNYHQKNYINSDNISRINNLFSSVKLNGYPYEENYIILFNNQNLIRDGQHRAAILANIYGIDHEIEILRFYFTNDNHVIKFYRELIFKISYFSLKKIIKLLLRK